MTTATDIYPLIDGTVYSNRKNFYPFTTPPLEAYVSIVGEEKIERLERATERLKGLKLLEISSTAKGGGVAEMLYSSIPFLNGMGIEAEWKVLNGNREYFECTKSLHNILQGKGDIFSSEQQRCYIRNIENIVNDHIIDYSPDVVFVHDPQPLGLIHYIRKPEETWFWRCHIDIQEETENSNPELWNFISRCMEKYDAAIFSAAGHVVASWPLLKFIVPPFIDPLSEKNRELNEHEVNRVLSKYNIETNIPIIAQIGRFDPWKGIDQTIATYRYVRKAKKCQLILAGGFATDDPEGESILNIIYEKTKKDEDIHVLNLSLEDRLSNYVEINALQRAASLIMQPSTREGFGLVITEALWKRKPVVAANVGAISLQIKEGKTGFFYQTPCGTAQKIIDLLEHKRFAEKIGEEGRRHVQKYFLLPDRIADYLMSINATIFGSFDNKVRNECVVSFRPWFRK